MAGEPTGGPVPSGLALLRRPTVFAAVWWFSVVAGWAVVGYSAINLATADLVAMGAPLVMMAVLVVVGELRPVITSWTGSIPVPFSTAFVFATLYLWGLAPAVALTAIGIVVSELAQRKPPWKLLFNVGQYALSVTAAWLVMIAFGVHPSPVDPLTALDGGDLPWLVLSWIAYHVVNLALVAGLHEDDGQTFIESFTEDFWFYTFSTMAVLALSPLVAIVAAADSSSWLLLPLLVFPLIAVYATARMSRDREHASLHDPLTDLPNRTLLARRTVAALVESRRQGTGVALCLLDLDRFKEVNDTLGHGAGDRLLHMVAHRVCDVVRPSDTVARLGGDEFAVLLPGAGREQDAIDVAERIHASLREPIRIAGVPVDVSVSIGVALAPAGAIPDESDGGFEALLRRADVAMYVAKANRRGLAVYDEAADPHSPERLGAASDLRAAIASGDLHLNFQPQVSVSGGHVVGVEALARWSHPTRGSIPPSEFIPLAERSGAIHELTAAVLDRALAQAAIWESAGLRVPVAVNVSMRDIQDVDVVGLVEAALDRHRLPPEALRLEVTESVLVQDADRVVAVVRRLSDAGVQCALDDFGTGFSTLVLLQRLPVAEVKIDRSFVASLAAGGDDGLVRAVVGLAHGLGLRVVAEGVESTDTLRDLARLGCDTAQGWVHAPAMPADEATAWLADHMWGSAAGAGPSLPGVDDVDPGVAEVPGVARGQVRAGALADGRNLGVETVDGEPA